MGDDLSLASLRCRVAFFCHPGLDPGSIQSTGFRLEAGMTEYKPGMTEEKEPLRLFFLLSINGRRGLHGHPL